MNRPPKAVLRSTFPILIAANACWLAVLGCATYSPVGDVYKARRPKLTVDLPDGWLRFRSKQPAYLMTRDGLRLEVITLGITRTGKKLPGTKRVYKSDMLPIEVADLSLALLGALEEVKNLQVERIETASVADHHGYRASGRFIHTTGLPMRFLVYGISVEERVCEFGFLAAEEVYYDKYLKDFEDMVASARIEKK